MASKRIEDVKVIKSNPQGGRRFGRLNDQQNEDLIQVAERYMSENPDAPESEVMAYKDKFILYVRPFIRFFLDEMSFGVWMKKNESEKGVGLRRALLTLLFFNCFFFCSLSFFLSFLKPKKKNKKDVDRSGDINLQELRMMMEKLGQAKTHLELKKMIAQVDKSGSGTIDFYEFLSMMFGSSSSVLKTILKFEEMKKKKEKPSGPPPKRDLSSLP